MRALVYGLLLIISLEGLSQVKENVGGNIPNTNLNVILIVDHHIISICDIELQMFKDGKCIDSLSARYVPGMLEIGKVDFERFNHNDYDSIMMKFEPYIPEDNEVNNSGNYTYFVSVPYNLFTQKYLVIKFFNLDKKMIRKTTQYNKKYGFTCKKGFVVEYHYQHFYADFRYMGCN